MIDNVDKWMFGCRVILVAAIAFLAFVYNYTSF
jgi:hypothetical protein